MDYAILEKIGLTKNESIVYLTLIELGTSKTGEILKKSKLNSGRIYEILESLKNKGVVGETIINNVKHFTAAPPEQLLEYIEKKREQLNIEEEKVRVLIPKLKKMRNADTKKIKVITYYGPKGLKTAVYEAVNLLREGDEIFAMGVTEKKNKKFNEFWKKVNLEYQKRKLKCKLIISDKGKYFKEIKKIPCVSVKVLEGITPNTVNIFGNDKVLIMNYKEPTSCILIYSEDTATSFKEFFEQLWKMAK
ncbi:hypothetical protein KO465_05965 [Candidatus Micrarchaeota archaeon]|nr:hypothetical protein [Candidatus Micrarchaeota archaeon]